MVSALLVAMLGVAPGIALADGASERQVRLVEGGPVATLELMSKQQLENEMLRLQNSRPSLLVPIILIPVGSVAAVAGLVLLNVGAALVFSKPALLATFLLTGGAILFLGGVVVAIIGIVKIGRLLTARNAIGVELDKIEQRLETLERLSHHEWLGANSTVLATF